MNQKKTSGFTLVELLVVVAIMAVLVIIGVTNFITAQQRARNNRRATDIEKAVSALEIYRADCGHYPNINLIGDLSAISDNSADPGCDPNMSSYITNSLEDPLINTATYYYRYNQSGGGSTYQLIYFNEPDLTPVTKNSP